jgi:hypothetical protein
MPDADRSRWYIWPLLALGAIACLLAVVAGVHWLYLHHNPFFDRTPEYREANALAASIHQRSLTDEEFARALALCETGPMQARGAGVSLLEESVKKNPERAPQTIDVLTRVAQSSDAELARYAATVLRLANQARPADPAANRR